MDNKSINYYGYDRDTYEDCQALIANMNRRHMGILNLWFLAITAVFLYFCSQNSYGLSEMNAPLFLGFLILEAACGIIFLCVRSFSDRMNKAFVIINMSALIVFGIICSASQPYMAATIYLVMLVLVSLSYISTFFQMTLALLLGYCAFLLVSYHVKPGSIFNQDVFNATIVLLLSLVLHYTFQRARIRQFITYRQSTRMQQELEIKSSFDALTSLLNRGRFFSMAGDIIRHKTASYTLLALMDLDKFKEINDTMGHQMGDKVIQLSSETILNTLGIDYGEKWSFPERAVKERLNFAGRLGGDEFVALIIDIGSLKEAQELFSKLLHTLNDLKIEGLNGINASIGVTVIREDDRDIDSAYLRADEALYNSKESGRNQVTFDFGDAERGLE
ncbi:MAG: GGDEF domain-containing protein [Lachnospiraceae bacterium]|nr:GGDEF domain-containing protein [Lachnospiraceae bacterium]